MKKRQRRCINTTKSKRAPVLTPLTAAVIAALYPLAPAMAQDAEDSSADAAVEEIIVTGSRIRRDTFSSAAPMEVVLTESAPARGITDLATLLQSTTVAMGSPQVTSAISATGDPSNGGLGTNTLSLRGLGANRTLVLLNGRRAGPSGVRGSVSSFDLNAIPLAAIERVEVLKDGASSIYGSDAVAGVVNIITRKDDGGSLDVFYSAPEQSGGEQLRLSGTWGKRLDRGYFRVTADYNKAEILKRGDRDYFSCDEDYVFEVGSGNSKRADLINPRDGNFFCDGSTWGHVWVYDYAAAVTESAPGAGDGTSNVDVPVFLLQFDYNGELTAAGLPPLPPATNPNDMTTPPGWFPVSRGDQLSNSLENSDHPFHDTTTLGPESENITLFLEGEYNISDNVTAYSEILLNRRETRDVGFRQIWTYVYNYDSADWGGFDGATFPSDPFSVGWTGAQWLSPLAITDKGSNEDVTVDYTRFVAGLTGETQSFLEGWTWDLSFQYSKSDAEYVNGAVLKDALELPFFRTGSCVGQITPISNRPCVDIQWLDPDFANGNLDADTIAYLFDTEKGTTEYTQWSVEGFMTGDVFEMPAGTAAMAIGFHYREDEILDRPGPITLAGNAWQGDSAGITAGEDTTVAFFAEVDLPLLADMPLVDRLDFTGSVRYTDVDSFGDDTTFKVGLNWSLNDQVRVRSTFGTSFRTPALFELYLADQSSGISQRNLDPCLNWGNGLAMGEISQRTADNCAADGIGPNHIATVGADVLTGGGLGVLKAETSESFTVGFIWQPTFADISLSVDYFDILVEDEVDVVGAQRIVAGCYESLFFPNEPLCDLFDRRGPTETLPNTIDTVRDSFINVAKQQLRGLDVAAQWVQELPGTWGTLLVDTSWTYNFEDTVALFDETEEDLAGLAGHPETVGSLNVTLDMDEWSFFWGMSYIGETDNFAHFGRNTTCLVFGSASSACLPDGVVEIDLIAEATTYHSLSASRSFDNGVIARLGVANVLDETPPRLTQRGTGNEVETLGEVAFYSQYDWLGRRYFFNLSMDFD